MLVMSPASVCGNTHRHSAFFPPGRAPCGRHTLGGCWTCLVVYVAAELLEMAFNSAAASDKIAGMTDQIKMAREHALLGNYEAS